MITGAAGQLGPAVAAAFADVGDRLILVDRSSEALVHVYGAPSPKHRLVAADLLHPDSLANSIDQVRLELGGIDVLCNLAGGFTMGSPVHATSAADWQLMQDLNVRTLLHAVNCVVPDMIERRFGKVINIGANAAQRGQALMGAYIASKSVVMRLTESMAAELREHGINVNCVMPSIIDTPANRTAMPATDPAKWVSPEEIAAVTVFLASASASAVHGACIPVTGLS